MNKSVSHNGKLYLKDSKIEQHDDNFKMLHEGGHLALAEASEIVLPKQDAQPVEPEKPMGKSKK